MPESLCYEAEGGASRCAGLVGSLLWIRRMAYRETMPSPWLGRWPIAALMPRRRGSLPLPAAPWPTRG